MCNKSAVLTKYNQMKRVSRLFPALVNVDRLNRALGIAMSQKAQAEDYREYHPTTCTCGCKDWEYRDAPRRKYTGACKHQLAAQLLLVE